MTTHLIGWWCAHVTATESGVEPYSDGLPYHLTIAAPQGWRDEPRWQSVWREAKAKVDAHAAVHGCKPQFCSRSDKHVQNIKLHDGPVPEYKVWTGEL